jgi:hypothetical protein
MNGLLTDSAKESPDPPLASLPPHVLRDHARSNAQGANRPPWQSAVRGAHLTRIIYAHQYIQEEANITYPQTRPLKILSSNTVLKTVSDVGHLPVDLSGTRTVREVCCELRDGEVLPQRNSSHSQDEIEFLMSRRLVVLLWEACQVATHLHVNSEESLEMAPIFMWEVLNTIFSCATQGTAPPWGADTCHFHYSTGHL